MGENNLPKFEAKADFTETINNAYKDVAQKPLQSSSSVIATLIDFFHNTVLYPMQKYNLIAKSGLEDFAKELKKGAEQIPDQYLVASKVNILGPAMEGLKYNLDEEHIREMFKNILLSNMDSRKQSKVLPSYIEVVKQLSKEDAEFLAMLKQEGLIRPLPISRVKLVNNNTGYFTYISNYSICLENNKYICINPIVLDNLLRLQILEIPFQLYDPNAIEYYDSFLKFVSEDPLIKMHSLIPNKHLESTKEKLNFTDFGTNFINICLS